MGRKGNSGYTNPDRRFGNVDEGYSGSLGLTQHYLERLDGDLPSGLAPAPGYTVWSKADTGITLDGFSKVEQWNDLSGNNLNFTQTTSDRRPSFDSSNLYLNNKPSVDMLNSVGYYMIGADNSLLNSASTGGFTYYSVVKVNNVYSFGFQATRTNGSLWTRGWGIFYSSGWKFWVNDWNDSDTRVTLSNMSQTSIPYIFKFVYNDNNNGDGSGILAQTIGNVNSRSGTNTSMTDTVNDPTTGDGIWLNYGGNSQKGTWQGGHDFGEVLFYNAPLSSAGQTITEDYLKAKYNITPG